MITHFKIWITFRIWYFFAIYKFNYMYHILLSISYLLSYYFRKSINTWRNCGYLKLGLPRLLIFQIVVLLRFVVLHPFKLLCCYLFPLGSGQVMQLKQGDTLKLRTSGIHPHLRSLIMLKFRARYISFFTGYLLK